MTEARYNHVRVEDLKKLANKFSPNFVDANADMAHLQELLKDPFALAAVMYKLAQEREQTNKLLREINQRLERLEQQKRPLPERPEPPRILPEQDQRIIELVKSQQYATADDIKTAMGYKGKNAASARLNKLERAGMLKKIRSGKKIFYTYAGRGT
ncbi:MAG: hypothetical protein JXA43_01510 [Candidatus Diapherotrites archaeon]|nr:hypothetical protein [Candidatus Diapherotrites archaeon]